MKIVLKTARESKNLNTRTLAQLTGIDQALISKFENGKRNPTKIQIHKLAEILEIDLEILTVAWLKQKIKNEIGFDSLAIKAMKTAITEFENLKNTSASSAALISVLFSEIDQLKQRLSRFPKDQLLQKKIEASLFFTFENNRIQGNQMSFEEVQKVIQNGETIAGKSMKEHLEVINYHQATQYIQDLAQTNENLNETQILKLHNILFRGIAPDNMGRYQSLQTNFKDDNHTALSSKMKDFIAWYSHFKPKNHPLLLACQVHEKFRAIAPFELGVLRISRLLLNLVLLQNGYLLLHIKKEQNHFIQYNQAMQTYQESGNLEPFLHCIATIQKENLTAFLSIS